VPTITGIEPHSGNQGETVRATITGTNFTGTSVDVSGTGVTVPSFTVDSDTEITATLVLAGAPGNRDVTVTTDNGTTDPPETFTINASPLTNTTLLETDVLATGLSFPQGIWGDGTDLYVSNAGDGTISKVNIETGATSLFAGSGSEFNSPDGLWGDGVYLYVADAGNHRIYRVPLAGGPVETFAGSGVAGHSDATGTDAQFSGPHALWGDGQHIYVADKDNHLIRKIVVLSRDQSVRAGG
jgi:catechol 2,3-dioxygenase-like lactoylglutathione lyase family enzyme